MYWEYFLAHNPDSSQITQPECSLSPGAAVQPDPGASLYWEYFLENNPANPQFAQVIEMPVTGVVRQPDPGASLYWEYFRENSPDGSNDAWFSPSLAAEDSVRP
jgi:hypothetical protein